MDDLDASTLRDRILKDCRTYVEKKRSVVPFIPGQPYLPSTAETLDGSDLAALVDASLDLWLTAERFSRELESQLPKYFVRKTRALLVNSGSLSQLAKVEGFIAARRRNYATLYHAIKSSPTLKEAFLPVEATTGTHPSWFGFPILCAPGIHRNHVVQLLEQAKIGTRLVFGGNLTKQPVYEGSNFLVVGSLSQTDQVMKSVFWLGFIPAYPRSTCRTWSTNLKRCYVC